MGIFAKNASRTWTTEVIVNATIGMEDPYGNPFRKITLDWNPARKNAQYAKTAGFEDAIIERTGSGLKINYRKPGSAQWIQNKLTRRFYAEIPDTPHNRATIAAGLRDKFWTVRDTDVRRVCEVMSDKLWRSFEPDVKEFHEKRIAGSWRGRYDDDDNNSAPPSMINAKAEEQEIATQKGELFKERQEIEKMREELRKDREKIDALFAQAAENGISVVQYKPEVLQDMKMTKLREIADEKGISNDLRMKKAELVEAIIAKQYGSDSLKVKMLKNQDDNAEDSGKCKEEDITE